MIFADRSEGTHSARSDSRSRFARLWRNLDRNVPLGIKLIIPVIFVTLAGTLLFGYFLQHQSRAALLNSYQASAAASAEASAKEFYLTTGHPAEIDLYIADLAGAQPDVMGIWVVNVDGAPGSRVVARSTAGYYNNSGQLSPSDRASIEAGRTSQRALNVNGNSVLQTIAPVTGNAFAVVVWTSLTTANEEISNTLAWSLIAAVIACAVEVGGLFVILETGVLRRIRRIRDVFAGFGGGSNQIHLSEGLEPEGHDALFNLAREVDHKLSDLTERDRAGKVVSDLGILSLQGVAPSELTHRALELTRVAADLDRCFLVETVGTSTVVESFDAAGGQSSEGRLPIWLAALVRSAAQSRRPILADSFGQDSHFWALGAGEAAAAAAFVPLPGTPHPIGVMVGIARQGAHISPVSVTLMESVATALGESLQRSEAEKARHESEIKSQALATVSHEMRNPLNAMLGFSSLLLTGAAGPLNPKQEGYVRRVEDASNHLLRLVNDYLDLARVMAGSLPFQQEAVVVGPEVEHVLGILRPMAEAKNVALRAEVSAEAVAHADRMRLRQVLMNLVSNSIKFTPPRGHVRVEVAGGSNGVRISVIDTGIGIPAARQSLVFTEFAALREDGSSAGAGLGLSLTKRFVEAMGGFIRFTSSEGAGTIFDVWLPGEQSPRLAHGAVATVSASPIEPETDAA